MKYIQLIFENMTMDPRFSHMKEGGGTARNSKLEQSYDLISGKLRPIS